MSAYLEVMLFGLRKTSELLIQMENDTVQSTILCGRSLFFGSSALSLCSLVGSPIPGSRIGGDRKLSVTKGAIFAGSVDITNLRRANATDQRVLWFSNKADGSIDVLVKCSCKGFHNWLVEPFFAFSALRLAQTAGANLSDVLLGAYQGGGSGIALLMSDLAKQGSTDLAPLQYEQAGKLRELWTAFLSVVRNNLIPLANCDVVHPDIRPGFDFTANLVCRLTTAPGIVMKLIDFASLTTINDWTSIMDMFERNVLATTSHKFVWWQCITMAFAWITKTDYSGMADMHTLQEYFTDDHTMMDQGFKDLFGEDWDDIQVVAEAESMSEAELETSIKIMDAAFDMCITTGRA